MLPMRDITRLSFEHVPPRSAFNNDAVFLAEIERLLGHDWWAEMDKVPGKRQQGGAGQYTLCEPCNNKTGSWYGSDYVHLARRAMPALAQAAAGEVVGVSVDIRPLRLLKQILVMFCSACGPNFVFPELARYLLNQESRELPPGHDVYLGLYDRGSRAARQSGLTGRLELGNSQCVYSEIAFPPLILVMTVNSPSPDPRLMRVTWFNQFGWRDRWQQMLILDCLQVNSPYPASYATREEIERNRPRRLQSKAVD